VAGSKAESESPTPAYSVPSCTSSDVLMRAARSFCHTTLPVEASSANSFALLLAKNTRFPSVADPAIRGTSGRSPSGETVQTALPVSASMRATFPAAPVTITELPFTSGVVFTPPSKRIRQRTSPVVASKAYTFANGSPSLGTIRVLPAVTASP
jgi:hypothetical protein